jgi:hypothetical protein
MRESPLPRNKLVSSALAVLAGVAAALMISPSPASAAVEEVKNAVAGTPPASVTSGTCVSSTGALVCFQPYGDTWWVKDTKADSASAVADWEVNSGSAIRIGHCVNSLGNGTWGKCVHDYLEGSLVMAVARTWDKSENKWSDSYNVGYWSA